VALAPATSADVQSLLRRRRIHTAGGELGERPACRLLEISTIRNPPAPHTEGVRE
jgi:hypothetical protein